jgi:uncharacterized protein YraI
LLAIASRLPALAATGVLALTGLAVASPARADAYYRAHAAQTVNLRTGPGTWYSIIQTIGPGTPVDIACQTPTQNIGGNPYWDHLTGGQWVADYYVDGTNFGRSPWIPLC